MLKKYHMILFFIFVAIENMAANLAHPVTPTLIYDLQLPDYSFGVIFAGMAFTNFLFSPFWAKQVTRMGSKKVLGICCAGYGIGQLLFSLMTTLPTIMFARVVAGFFVGGIMVSILTYIIHNADVSQRGKYLALSATLTTVFSAFGYLVGGYCGVWLSIKATFIIQTIILILNGLLFYVCLQDDSDPTVTISLKKDANPFKAFIDSKNFMTTTFFILFFVVFVTSCATTAYDQNFNYYIKDQFGFDSSYNGAIKALVGFVSLIANTTICMWLMKKTDVKTSILSVIFGVGVLLVIMTYVPSISAFLGINILFYALNAIYIPLVQDLCASASSSENSNMVMGFYNAMKSLGMIVGALFAGFIYTVGPELSFLYAGIFYLISGCFMIWYRARRKKELID